VSAGQFSVPFAPFAPSVHIEAQSSSVLPVALPGSQIFASTTSPLVGTVNCDLMCAQSAPAVVVGRPLVVMTTASRADE